MDFGDIDGSPHCVFWDHDLFQGKGGWSDGMPCRLPVPAPPPVYLRLHLTAFSILMSGHGSKQPHPGAAESNGLGSLHSSTALCLGVYRLAEVCGAEQGRLPTPLGPASTSWSSACWPQTPGFLGAPPPCGASQSALPGCCLCHFLYLATFFWMLAQALMLAHQLLFVFHQLSKAPSTLPMVLLGYLCPMGLAGITLGLYLPLRAIPGKARGHAGWTRKEEHSIPSWVQLAIVGEWGCTHHGCAEAAETLKSEGPQVEKRQALLGVTAALLILTPISGLTWGLGLALLEEVSIVPHYLFTVLNALPGVGDTWQPCLPC